MDLTAPTEPTPPPVLPGRIGQGYALSWPTALVAAAMLFTVNCAALPENLADETTCRVEDGGIDIDTDEDGDGLAPCGSDDSFSDASVVTNSPPNSQPGGTLVVNAVAGGDPSLAAASTKHSTCYAAAEATSVSGTVTPGKVQFDLSCPGQAGTAGIDLELSVSKNGEPALVVLDANATIGCDDESVAVTEFLDCAPSIPGRFECTVGDGFLPDLVAVQPGDIVQGTLQLSTTNELASAEPGEDGVLETTATATYFLSGSGLAATECPDPGACLSDEDCEEPQGFCLDGRCRALAFAEDAEGSFATSPAPALPGQAFDVTASVTMREGDLLPYEVEVRVAEEAVALDGPLSEGLVLGSCTFGETPFPLVLLASQDEMVADLDGDGLAGQGEPTARFGPDGQGDFVVLVRLPSIGGRLTVPSDATLTCQFSSLLLAGDEGVHPLEVRATSLDIDTGAEDDQGGTDPVEVIAEGFELVVGEDTPPPPVVCGDAVNSGSGLVVELVELPELAELAATPRGAEPSPITAADALRVLRAAVGTAMCLPCICDVNSSGSITAGDALLVLRAAVGQEVTLVCPGCEQE